MNINEIDNNITYYIKQTKQDLISYNTSDNFEIVEYVCDSIHDYFNNYKYEIIIDYKEPLITFIYKNHKFNITIKNLFNNSLYWILDISLL